MNEREIQAKLDVEKERIRRENQLFQKVEGLVDDMADIKTRLGRIDDDIALIKNAVKFSSTDL